MNLSTMILKMSEGLGNTCAIFFLTLLFSLPLGMVFALLRMSKSKVVSSVMRFIISVLCSFWRLHTVPTICSVYLCPRIS